MPFTIQKRNTTTGTIVRKSTKPPAWVFIFFLWCKLAVRFKTNFQMWVMVAQGTENQRVPFGAFVL